MSDTVIKVENLSKLYRLGELHKQTNSFREKVTQAFSRIAHSAKRKVSNPISSPSQTSPSDAMPHACPVSLEDRTGTPSTMPSSFDDTIWALRHVSFEVKRGEIIGIIGQNGAGKSTLLKVLSRITKPTEGKALISGRVGSLLEVGTGFHPELTGRENIFLNGAILGMSKLEIQQNFDKIVNFAEVEKFIDTPVKRYSSGMYVRLAFAVAAHLEPEILIVDEILAVGDVTFQKKCLGKMENISKKGFTVVFVSHNMSSIQALCNRSIFLADGSISKIGSTTNIVSAYLNFSNYKNSNDVKDEQIDAPAYIIKIDIVNSSGIQVESIRTCDDFFIVIKWKNRDGVSVNPNLLIEGGYYGSPLMMTIDTNIDWSGSKKSIPGNYISRVRIPGNFLNAGNYWINVSLDRAIPRTVFYTITNAIYFNVYDPNDNNCKAHGEFIISRNDIPFLTTLEWEWEGPF